MQSRTQLVVPRRLPIPWDLGGLASNNVDGPINRAPSTVNRGCPPVRGVVVTSESEYQSVLAEV